MKQINPKMKSPYENLLFYKLIIKSQCHVRVTALQILLFREVPEVIQTRQAICHCAQ